MLISASRRTDLPAFYLDWFLNRLREGWFLIPHPRNPRQFTKLYVSRESVDGIVFWSKNPKPLLERLDELLELKIPFYLHYTLNAYGEAAEPGVPPLEERLAVFEALSERLGPSRVIWRYDPVIIQGSFTLAYHYKAFEQLSRRLAGKTERCILSFLDLYPARMPGAAGVADRTLTQEEMYQIAGSFSSAAKNAEIALFTCCEATDLSGWGIQRAACIDRSLAEALLGCTLQIKKDAGQRPACGCAESVDVGSYDTCGHGCVYCYACSRGGNRGVHVPNSPLLAGVLPPGARVFEKRPSTNKTGQTSLF